MNIQDGNVGNRGDVAKHVALVALASLLRERSAGPVRHVETHAYRLSAPLSRSLEGGTAAWRALQEPWVARGRYRCSAGLAVDVLGAGTRLLLAEVDAATREGLAEDVATEGWAVDALLDDARHLAAVRVDPALPLFIHVDPFDHPRNHWEAVRHLVTTARRPDHPAVVLAFGYDRAGPIDWPPEPPGLVALGHWQDPPYGLAAWATEDISGPAQARVRALGWAC